MVFAYSTMTIIFFLAIFVPKRISFIEIYSTFFFAYWLGITTDIILDFKYNLYGYESNGIQLTCLVFVTTIYFSVNTLFLDFFPYNKSLLKRILYILLWSIFSIAYESTLVHTGFFYYKGWRWWYSALLYPILFSVLRLNLFWVQKMLATHYKQKTEVNKNVGSGK